MLSSNKKKPAEKKTGKKKVSSKTSQKVSLNQKLCNILDGYLDQHNWQVNENGNTGYSLQGLNNYLHNEVTKQYWLGKIYPKEIGDASRSGDMHIHDMGSLSTYCVGWDLQDLLTVGFRGPTNKIESKPAKHFRTALGQLVNFFYTMQGESAGAQAVSNFDTLLAPFIRYDNLNTEQIEQAFQEFFFNMNTPTRVGFQTPFTNVTIDLYVPTTLANTHVIIGGEPQRETYSEFQEEMNMFNKAFIKVISKGDAKGRVFTFPIPTYNITKDFDWDNSTLDGLWEATAKYGIPYFSNFVNSDMKPEDARSMCCRLRLDNRILRKRGGGLFGANPLTGSIGVVTINLPRLGYLANNKQDFLKRLLVVMDMAKESLEIKRVVIEKFTDSGLYPYSKFFLRNIKERFKSYWSNHFATIGLVGMNEACINLLGKDKDIGTKEGHAFANEVLEFMRDKIQEYQESTGNYYNLEATPAEGTSYRLAQKDKNLYPDIIAANEPDPNNTRVVGQLDNTRVVGQLSQEQIKAGAVKADTFAPFYTNSSHLPVDYTNDVFELLDHQDDLQTKYTGGTVVHVFLGEQISDINAIKAIVKTICHRYHLPYFTLTPTFSVCPVHGYISGNHPVCKTCGVQNTVYSRVVGYLAPVSQWNIGKKAEFKLRKTYEKSFEKKRKKKKQPDVSGKEKQQFIC